MVSILIAAHNEENVIGHKIENCLKLDYPSEALDIWIASDGSSDRTNEIVKDFVEKSQRVHLLEFPRSGKAAVLNQAMQYIKSEVVVFSDANTEYATDAIKALVSGFFDSKVGCVCGKLVYRNPKELNSGKGEGLYWRYENALKKMESRIGWVAGANGAIYAIVKDLFEPIPAGTINDDFMISMRIVKKGFKCTYEEKAIAYEDVAPTVSGEFNRHIRDGAGHYLAIKHLVGLLNPFLGLRSFVFLSHRILRWIAPMVILSLFLVNMLLLKNEFYKIVFFVQIVFYLLALSGLIMVKSRPISILFYVPFYFCNLNLALLLGFVRAVIGKQKATWERTERY